MGKLRRNDQFWETIPYSMGASAWVIASDAPQDVRDYALVLQTMGSSVYVCDGVADNVEIQAAIDAAYAIGGGDIQASGPTFNFANTVIVKNKVRLAFGEESLIIPTANVNLIQMKPKSSLFNPTFRTFDLNNPGGSITFTSACLFFDGADQWYQAYPAGVGDYCHVERPKFIGKRGFGGNEGTAIKMIADAAGEDVCWVNIRDIEIYGFKYGLWLRSAAGSGVAFINCNNFFNIRGFAVENFIFLDVTGAGDNAVGANIFRDWQLQATAESLCAVYSNGGANDIDGVTVDWSGAGGTYAIDLGAASALNKVRVAGPNILTLYSRDLGTNNSIESRSEKTKNSGTAIITAAATTVVVTHGLYSTPTRVFVSPTLLSSSNKWWVTAMGTTTFTINVDVVPGVGKAIFDWLAQVGEG